MNRREALRHGLVAGVAAPFIRESTPDDAPTKSIRAGAWVSEWLGCDKAGSITIEFTRPTIRHGRPSGRALAAVYRSGNAVSREEARVNEGENGTFVLLSLLAAIAPVWTTDWDHTNAAIVYGRLVGAFDARSART